MAKNKSVYISRRILRLSLFADGTIAGKPNFSPALIIFVFIFRIVSNDKSWIKGQRPPSLRPYRLGNRHKKAFFPHVDFLNYL